MPQLGDVRIVGETRDQRVMIAPFPDSAHYATWEPHRATIEKTDGRVVLERSGLVSPFDGQERGTTWEPFQALQYTSATSWNWFVSPFIFARPDFVNEEIEPWKENGALWRRLRVTYPGSIVTYCRQQTFFFDDAGLLWRVDYSDGFLGGEAAVQYVSGYVEYDGIMVATRRRVYVGNVAGSLTPEEILDGDGRRQFLIHVTLSRLTNVGRLRRYPSTPPARGRSRCRGNALHLLVHRSP